MRERGVKCGKREWDILSHLEYAFRVARRLALTQCCNVWSPAEYLLCWRKLMETFTWGKTNGIK